MTTNTTTTHVICRECLGTATSAADIDPSGRDGLCPQHAQEAGQKFNPNYETNPYHFTCDNRRAIVTKNGIKVFSSQSYYEAQEFYETETWKWAQAHRRQAA